MSAEILSRLALIVSGIGWQADPALVDDQVIAVHRWRKEVADARLTGRRTPRR